MYFIGLTGGIGSGKSTVSGLLRQRGAVIVDADAIVKELQQPGEPVFEAMVAEFGDEIVAPDGTLARQRVADIVFNDSSALERLNAIVHPAVGEEMLRRLQEQAETDHLVVLDHPLLAELGMVEHGYGGFELEAVVVVDVDPEIAVERLVEHRGFSEPDARARIAAQADRPERLAVADRVIDNSGTLDELVAQVERLWDWIGARVDS